MSAHDLLTKEDYKFHATLSWPSGEEKIIPCKLFLPQRITERPRLALILNEDETFHLLAGAPLCHLRAELGTGVGSTKIEATDVHIGGGSQRYWGEGLNEGYLLGYPSQLRVTHRLQDSSKERTQGDFALTHSKMLEPLDIPIYKADGTVEVRKGERLTFDLDGQLQLSFDTRYRPLKTNSSHERHILRELIASFEVEAPGPEFSPLNYVDRIDDLLFLVSLAERQRCACLAVRWVTGLEYVELFRLDRAIPAVDPNHSHNDFLIDTYDFSEFLRKTYSALTSSEHPELLRHALHCTTDFESSTIDEKFKKLFSALESILLIFRKRKSLEFVLADKSKRSQLKKDLKAFLKSHPALQDQPGALDRVYENLSGLERVSLRTVAKSFAEEQHIGLDDLWPLYDVKEGLSLTQLRNKLTHGEYFSEPEWGYIVAATNCLRWTVERFLLAALGWDYDRSRVFEMETQEQRKWKKARAELSSQ